MMARPQVLLGAAAAVLAGSIAAGSPMFGGVLDAHPKLDVVLPLKLGA